MIFFIVFLRALAACLITNSHYTGIYPTDIIANGGLIGDILFFSVSGYCLFNVKKSFPAWYGKRIARIYPPVLLITAIYFLLGQYSFASGQTFVWWFIYPTSYHFVGSILLLYIPFWFIGKFEWIKKRIPLMMLIIAIAYLIVYILFYDKTYYHIDTVREPMILFLFFESMLLGAHFRQNDEYYRNDFHWWQVIAVISCAVIYFLSKMIFSRGGNEAFQILNQFSIFFLLYFILRLFSGLDKKLETLPKWLKTSVSFLSEITLEIYVVQSVIIEWLRSYFSFPLNWVIITVSIIIAAWLLHFICALIEKCVVYLAEKLKVKKGKEEEIS